MYLSSSTPISPQHILLSKPSFHFSENSILTALMASGPLSSSSRSFLLKKPVFFSFEKDSTVKYFMSRVATAMKMEGINVQMEKSNDEEMMNNHVHGIIEKSFICIPILSKSYAKSRRCLMELTKMVECNKPIVPVFYDVDPSEVRSLRGAFDEAAIRGHESDERASMDFKKASKTVTEIPGFDLKNAFNGNQAKLIEILTTKVMNMIFYDMPMHPVGVESRVEDVMKLLNVEADDVRIIGIHGEEGTGKTMLARAIYHNISNRYEAACSIENIRESMKQDDGLVNLRNRLVSQILREKSFKNGDRIQDVIMLKKHFPSMRILVVLDDVDNENQLLALAGSRDWFGSGSRIIVTTRNENILKLHRMEITDVYHMRLLTHDESLQLFSWHAFGKPEPTEQYMELSEKVVCASSGVPLTLKRSASLLRQEEPNVHCIGGIEVEM